MGTRKFNLTQADAPNEMEKGFSVYNKTIIYIT